MAEKPEINPAEEVVCAGELREWNDVDATNVLLAPVYNAEARYSVLVGRLVFQIKDGSLPLLIENPGSITVKLPEGIKVATAEPIVHVKRVVFEVHENEVPTALDDKIGLEAAIHNIGHGIEEEDRNQLMSLLEK